MVYTHGEVGTLALGAAPNCLEKSATNNGPEYKLQFIVIQFC